MLFLTEDVNKAYNTLHKILQSHLNLACPFIRTQRKVNVIKQCWDDECTQLKGAYIQALEQEIRSGSAENKKITALRKKEYDLKLKTLRKQQTAAHISKADNKSKALWQIINMQRKATSTSENQPTLKVNGTIIKNPVDIADHFNTFFSTIAEKTLNNKNINTVPTPLNMQPITNNRFNFQAITEKETQHVINSLKPKTSSGVDDISAKLTKACKEELAAPLANIINKSLQQGTFPAQLKISKVYPKYKKGSTSETNSYRPISLIPTFSKIIEKIVLKQLLCYLEQNNLLTHQQHGFLKGRSTATAIIQLVEHIIDKLEEGCTVTSLFLDFSKAFDCLSHSHLVEKLKTLGIVGTSANWFSSYLADRKQLVELRYTENNTTERAQSKQLSVRRGVPQGSVLGPVLFLLLTNDLPNHLQGPCQTVMYADDTVITIAEKSNEQMTTNAEGALTKAKEYCVSNDLVLNEEKTVQVVFTTKSKNVNTGIESIDFKFSTKHLGIVIDSTLTWKLQVDQLCKKLSSGTFLLRRLKQISTPEAIRTAYFAFLESHIRYGIATWGGTSSTNLERVLVQQKRAIRCLAGLGYRESCRTAFVELRILTVVALYIQEVILHTVSTTHPRHQDIHHHNTRHASNFTLPPHHLSLFSKKPTYAGAKLFNTLPEELKNTPTQHLKKRLNDWLTERPFYTVEEYLKKE